VVIVVLAVAFAAATAAAVAVARALGLAPLLKKAFDRSEACTGGKKHGRPCGTVRSREYVRREKEECERSGWWSSPRDRG